MIAVPAAPALVVLTGAGISAESGLGTFRSSDGLWAKYDLRKVATPEAFARDPQMVHDFYNLRRRACLDAAPNAAHLALARLQRDWKGSFHLITQNVDDLHERGGAGRVLHMHGEHLNAWCTACDVRSRGHRQHNTTVRIVDIAAAGGKAKKASKKSEAAAEAAE